MSYDRQHILLTWGGDLPGGEHWSCSLRCAPVAIVPGAINMTDDDIEGLQASYVPAVKDFHTRGATGISRYAALTWVKLATIGTDGKYIPDQTSVVESVFAPMDGGVNLMPFPNQVALCITTTTAQQRGYGHAGRFYLPLPTATVNNQDGLISTGDADAIKGSVKTFIEAIADVPGIDTDLSPEPVVMSTHGSGKTNKITGAKVGRALDTQRRRRRSLPENYRIVAVDTGAF